MKNLFENFHSKDFNSKNLKLMLKRAYEKYQRANSSFWVTSLSFYTILAIVPMFAILFSLASWFGAEDYIVNQIKGIAPLKEETLELLTSFSNNLLTEARNNVLAGVGFLFLGWTFIQMFSLIEESFNEIWHIKRARSLVRKISDYVSFFIFLPLLFIILNGLILFLLAKIKGITFLYYIVRSIFPFVSMTIFFMALYLVMPNTTVKIFPAFTASLIVSVAFILFQYVFILLQFLLIGYHTVYGGFSIIFIFLIWIRISWFIIILGVHITYLIQNANFDINVENDAINISFNSKLYITFKVLEEIVKRYLNNQSPPNMNDLRKATTSSPFLIGNVLDELIRGGYVVSSQDYSEKIFCVAKNIEEVSLKEIYDFIANTGEEIYILQDGKITDGIEKIIINKDYNRTLKSLGGESAEEN
ncbi:YihY/virulence factor BrkB family protein [Fusobacterium simiae]|uniref:YihY/virulence factor BrkB family protein n=1 Tax=Fusobacterium simiae TaxID=855 RepID=A0ABT4DEX7_FUSSI|nr:YihY/virulence factor BrkB family protein [Fusobacterium simiae]MCY7007153.1 YihY/virulence factor BrkB family protein [Fusobacterium simiae]